MHKTPLVIDDRTRLIALAFTRRIGRVLIERLLHEFGSLEAVLAASESDLRRVQGIGRQIAATITHLDLSPISADLLRFTEQHITIASYNDSYYPLLLQHIDDKPLAVFWKGAILEEDLQSIAIIGTREGQSESLRLAEQLGFELAKRGWTVVSGLARGIDQAAHEGALRAAQQGSGRTIAVLGCGVNVVYPPENAQLARKIIGNGALISELHPEQSPSPNALVRRNRLTSALSRAVVIVEAGATSGALHAAHSAHLQGRPVFVVNNSAGNAQLLREFAFELPSTSEELTKAVKRYEIEQGSRIDGKSQ